MLDEKLPIKQTARPARRAAPEMELDQELAAKALAGDRQALARLVDRHLTPLYRYLLRRLGPGHEALISKIVEATFTQATRRMGPYASGSASVPMRLWLIRLANRHLARQKRTPRVETMDSSGDGAVEVDKLREALAALPGHQQAAFALAMFEQLPPREVAAAMGVSPARAMGLLRSALRQIGEEVDLEPAMEGFE